MSRPNGYILYKGPSKFDGREIVVVSVGHRRPSQNAATGQMIQIYILDWEVEPVAANRSGLDASICGGCKLRGRGGNHRECYVQLYQAPATVWRAAHNGSYPEAALNQFGYLFGNQSTRLGAYGDPAAVPAVIWRTVIRCTARWTGYTHSWRSTPYARYLMASTDSKAETKEAWRRGWRTFRKMKAGDTLLRGEVLCPKSAEAGYKTKCEYCTLCRGTETTAKSVAIYEHGWAFQRKSKKGRL